MILERERALGRAGTENENRAQHHQPYSDVKLRPLLYQRIKQPVQPVRGPPALVASGLATGPTGQRTGWPGRLRPSLCETHGTMRLMVEIA